MTGLTESLARFVANPGFDAVPAEAARIVRTGFIDTVATMIAGRDEPVVRIVREFVAARQSAVREAHVLFGGALAATADAALINATAHDVKPADVARVHAWVGVAQASMLRNHAPVTGLEAKFSLELAVASALVARKVGLRELTDAFVSEPQVRAVMSRVSITTLDTRCPIEPVFALTDRVALELNDGRTLDSGEIRFPRGNAKLPLADAELKAKFLDCATGADDVDAARLYAHLDALDELANVRDLAVRTG